MSLFFGKRSSRLLALTAATFLGLPGAVVAGSVPAWAGGRPSPGAAGLGDRLYPLLGNGGYDVQNYDLSLFYPKKDPAQSVRGDVTITAVATQNLSRFDLDFAGDSVGRVTVNGKPATFTRSGEELVITPKHPLPEDRRFTVRVSAFVSTPIVPDEKAPAGFVITPDGTMLAGQPDRTHDVFPSNDHPRDKATYTITLTAPKGWTGTASGRLLKTRERGGYVSSTYREAHPMASELVQLAVGDFVVVSRPDVAGVPIRDVVPTRLADTLLPKAADETNEMTWMVQQVGAYPFENYGTLVIDGELGFALETQSLSLFDTYFFKFPAFDLNPIMAHELAHQWFGDSVAPYEWSDVWLNEGHATWYELNYALATGVFSAYTGTSGLETYFKRVYWAGDQYRAQYGPVGHPLKSDSMWDVFNRNVYDGGALVLYALQQQIGADKFQQLERAWVTEYRDRTASSRDFVALANRVSGQDLTTFLNDWLYGTTTPPMPGHPDWTPDPVTTAPALTAATLTANPLFFRR